MKLKIRFVRTNGVYFAQRKTCFGWKYITYTIDMGYGSVVYNYTNKSKKELLSEILDKKYSKCKRHVTVYEYGGLKIY